MVRGAAFILGLAMCSSASAAPQLVSTPAVGEVSTREIGDPMFEVAFVDRVPGLTVTQTTEAPIAFGSTIIIPAGSYPAKGSGKKVKYCGTTQVRAKNGATTIPLTGCLKTSELDKWKAPYQVGTVALVSASNYRQELLYQGKSGSELRVSYREFTGDMARPAFSQDLVFDLRESPIIGTKGARVEVIEATNTSIRYRLLQPFAAR